MGLDYKPASASAFSTTKKTLQERAVEDITDRLSRLNDLHLPFSLSSKSDSLTLADKKAHLVDLLHRDAAVFLERHGSRLSSSELEEFDVLNGEYEVNWHLNHLKSALVPLTEKDKKAVVKNRRLAYMDKLIQDGDFFSEDAMRMRAPLLYHEYLGQFQDPLERAFARPGERWSEMLIRQGEEDEYQARLKLEKENAGIVEEDDDDDEEDEAEEEEEEEEEDKEEKVHAGAAAAGNVDVGKEKGPESQPDAGDGSQNGIHGSTLLTFEERQQIKLEDFTRYMYDKFLIGETSSTPSISREEMQCKMDDFTRVMQEKFLSGEESAHFDYVHIDHDTALDDYWLEEMSQDAEDKYFDDD